MPPKTRGGVGRAAAGAMARRTADAGNQGCATREQVCEKQCSPSSWRVRLLFDIVVALAPSAGRAKSA
ncbi:hypothetical protein [Roseiflexus sp.]|uniref:hypothetical protein n=1 Tax=Roseiflexus sp. TaxID=2562120 RepID=UPI00398B0A91